MGTVLDNNTCRLLVQALNWAILTDFVDLIMDGVDIGDRLFENC